MSADKKHFSLSPRVSWQDGPWQRHRFPSHTIWTRAHSTARVADISHQSIGMRRAYSDNETRDTERREIAELAGSRGWGQEVAVFPTRRTQPSRLLGMKPLLLNVGHSSWLPLRFVSSSLYLEPGHLNTVWLTEGSGELHTIQEHCTVHIYEDNMNIVCVLLTSQKVDEHLNWQLIIDYTSCISMQPRSG